MKQNKQRPTKSFIRSPRLPASNAASQGPVLISRPDSYDDSLERIGLKFLFNKEQIDNLVLATTVRGPKTVREIEHTLYVAARTKLFAMAVRGARDGRGALDVIHNKLTFLSDSRTDDLPDVPVEAFELIAKYERQWASPETLAGVVSSLIFSRGSFVASEADLALHQAVEILAMEEGINLATKLKATIETTADGFRFTDIHTGEVLQFNVLAPRIPRFRADTSVQQSNN